MQLDARIDSRDHECLGDDSLRIGRRGYEPSDQQGGHNSNMAHGVPLQTVIGFLASAIVAGGLAQTHSFAPRTIPPQAPWALDRGDMHYNSYLADVMEFLAHRASSVELYFRRQFRAVRRAVPATAATSGLPCCRHGLKAFKRLLFRRRDRRGDARIDGQDALA